jgi:hypothetical protein
LQFCSVPAPDSFSFLPAVAFGLFRSGLGRDICEQNTVALRPRGGRTSAEQRLSIAFVPCSTATGINPGASIYTGIPGMISRRQVGQFDEVLDTEVSDKHPFFNKDLRWLFVRVNFEDTRSDRTQVVFSGKAPLLF